MSAPVVVGAFAVSLVAAAARARSEPCAARLRCPPAEAMRPEAPGRYRPSILERAGIGRAVRAAGRMVVRNIERQPVRTLTSIIGIGFASSMLVLGMFFLDSIDEVMRVQFTVVQRQDLTVDVRRAAVAGARSTSCSASTASSRWSRRACWRCASGPAIDRGRSA